MSKIWIINQFANTPDLPGHTRQFEVAKYLANKGFEVTVFSSDFNLSKRKFCKLKKMQLSLKENISNVNFIWLRVIPYYRNNWKRVINLISFSIHLFLRILFEASKANLPNVILASSPQLPAAFVSYLLASFFKIPFIFEVRDLWPQILIDLGGKNKDNLIIKLLFFIEKILYKRSNLVVVLSKGSEKYAQAKGSINTIWLPNGPDLSKFKMSPLPEHKEGFTKERPFLIIYAGTHGEANGLENIINTAKYLDNDPVKFMLVGDGPEKRILKKRALNLKNIEFKSTVPQSRIPELIAKADAVIHSLKKVKLFEYGVSPNKLYDAYAIGRPVITTTPGIINEEVEINRLGVTSPPEDPKALAKAIKRLLQMPRSERIDMGNRARKLAEEVYSRNKISESYEKIFNYYSKI